MPRRQVNVMTERWQFVRDARQRLVTLTKVCALYGISRVTGYKWLHRAEQSVVRLNENPLSSYVHRSRVLCRSDVECAYPSERVTQVLR